MGVGTSKHRTVIKQLEAATKLHHLAHEEHHEEHTTHAQKFEEKHRGLKQIIGVRKKEWAAQDAGWRALAEAIKAEEEAIKAKEQILISKIVEMLSGKMFSVCFREWKALTQSLKRQRFREAYRTQVKEHEFDNNELHQAAGGRAAPGIHGRRRPQGQGHGADLAARAPRPHDVVRNVA